MKTLHGFQNRSFFPLLVGRGKLARHTQTYFQLKNLPFLHWPDARELTPDFDALTVRASCLVVLVSDRAIEPVFQNIKDRVKLSIPAFHACGGLSIPGTRSVHPLMTFGEKAYPESIYDSVPLTLIEEEWREAPDFPGWLQTALPNPVTLISENHRTLYHAFCCLMSNFPQILWSVGEAEARRTLGTLPRPFPKELFRPILQQAALNYVEQGSRALTGPLVRDDSETIQKHLRSLEGSPLLPIYQAFQTLYSDTFKKENL